MPATQAQLSIGTRTSALARWQTDFVAETLEAAWPGLIVDVHPYSTSGDANLSSPLPAIGGKGAFTAELEQALLTGEIDVAVHSLKDLPVQEAVGLTIGAILPRADVRDVLVSRENLTIATLPRGAVVGTSSLRRSAQLLRIRPDLKVASIRGNVETRIRKVMDGDYDATILAAAGIHRLGLQSHIADYFELDMMLPAPGQGALAVQCRVNDKRVHTMLRVIDDFQTRQAVTAERAFLHTLQAGCSAPVAAFASSEIDGTLFLRSFVGAADGSTAIMRDAGGSDPLDLGVTLAEATLAAGAAAILNSQPTIAR